MLQDRRPPRARRRAGSARRRRDAARPGPRPAARPGGPTPASARQSAAGCPGRGCGAAALDSAPAAPRPRSPRSAACRSRSPAVERRAPAAGVTPPGRRRPRHGATRSAGGVTLSAPRALGEHADAPRVDLRSSSGSAWPPDPVRTGGCSAASTRWSGARRRSRSRAAPSPSGPDRSDTDAAWCAWRTAARPAANATRRTTFDQVHKVSGSAWLRRDSDRNSGPRARLSVPRWRR